MYFDVHCHLVQYPNIKEIIAEAKENQIKILSVSMNLQDNIKNLELLDEKQVGIMFGIHPMITGTRKFKHQMHEEVVELINHHKSKIAGIGEIGLDRSMHPKFFEKQENYFKKYLELAQDLKLGVTLHGRRAQPQLFAILENYEIHPTVIHWYYGPENLIDVGIKRGYYFSITPAIFYSPHKRVAEKVPLQKLLTESDGPCPFEHLKRGSVPTDVIAVVQEIAKVKNLDVTYVKEEIFKTSTKLYQLFK
ncbi:MAG: TatD family deoxyribonuclease [Candidatus Lokiarchaeota archaeon]|nr:TatD family deoxyribonuclease [Candidatus Lokiarchaeota archaeon]